MLELYLIRHAVTAENLNFTMIGRTDSPLHELGRRQADELAKRLHSIRFDALFTSPLQRARETASAIADIQEGLPMTPMADLREIDLGIIDGLSSFAAYEQYKAVFDEALRPDTNDFAFPGGELRSHALARFTSALREICMMADRAPSAGESMNRAAVVTHGGLIGLWLASLNHQPLGAFRSWQPAHASITLVHVTEKAEVAFSNDTTHLPASLQRAIEEARNSPS